MIWLTIECWNCLVFLYVSPLSTIFKSCLSQMKFPMEWKKAHVVPIHKKSDKQCIKNFRTVSLLPICSKIFERLLFSKMYDFIYNFIYNLLSSNQSGFRPDDSFTNQLLSISHEMYQSFDNDLKVRGIHIIFKKIQWAVI